MHPAQSGTPGRWIEETREACKPVSCHSKHSPALTNETRHSVGQQGTQCWSVSQTSVLHGCLWSE